MEEDIFNFDDDQEMQKLAKEASGISMPYPARERNVVVQAPQPETISDDDIDRLLEVMPVMPVAPVPPPAPAVKQVTAPVHNEKGTICNEKVTNRRKVRPWLLDTHKTLVEHGRVYYEGKDFSFDSHRRMRRRNSSIEAEWKSVFYNVIVPNGIVARECGARVFPKEAIDALDFAMTVKRNQGELVDWKQCREKIDMGKLMRRFNYYANGIGLSRNGVEYYVPESRMFSHADYVQKSIRSFADKIPEFDYSGNPRLRELIDIFNGDRSIGSLKTREVRDRFGVSMNAANAFKQWIRERRESGRPDNEFTISY